MANTPWFKLCVATGPIGAGLLFVGLWPAMHFLPPLDPLMNAAEVAGVYRANQTGIIVGSICLMLGCSLLIPFFCALSAQMKRIEGLVAPLTYTQLLTALFGVVPVFMAAIIFTAAAYRPERPDDLIYLLSDIAFLSLTIPSLPGTVQFLAFGLAILQDKREQPIFPRWLAFVNFWIAIIYIPGCLIGLFKVGPFNWRGALSFWLIAIVLGLWINLMTWALLRANRIPDDIER